MSERLRDEVNNALSRLAANLGLDDLHLEAEGTIGLDFEDEISCTTEVPAGSDTIYLYAPVMRVPAIDDEALSSRLLRLNLFTLRCPGTWLALDDDEVLVCRAVAGRHFHADEFPELLLSMTEEVRSLRQLLLAHNYNRDGDHFAERGHFIRG